MEISESGYGSETELSMTDKCIADRVSFVAAAHTQAEPWLLPGRGAFGQLNSIAGLVAWFGAWFR